MKQISREVEELTKDDQILLKKILWRDTVSSEIKKAYRNLKQVMAEFTVSNI